MIVRDEITGLTFVRGQLQKEGLPNPNAVKSCLTCLDKLPSRSSVYREILAELESFQQPFHEPLTKRLQERLQQPFHKQLAEQLQEPLQEQTRNEYGIYNNNSNSNNKSTPLEPPLGGVVGFVPDKSFSCPIADPPNPVTPAPEVVQPAFPLTPPASDPYEIRGSDAQPPLFPDAETKRRKRPAGLLNGQKDRFNEFYFGHSDGISRPGKGYPRKEDPGAAQRAWLKVDDGSPAFKEIIHP
ncbi:MAG: LYR motif-containing protein, partial [Deltaproteobacteria bacterium]|nr:LYR motif-containing protein [Deltaproteobacteria bacterium]